MSKLKDLKTVKVNFNLRDLKEKDQLTGVDCVVRWNKNRIVLTSVERIKPRFWDVDNQKAISKLIGYSEFNSRLRSIKNKIEDAYRIYLNDNGQYPTVEELRSIAKKELNKKAGELTTHSRNLIQFIEQFIKDCETGVITVKGSPMSPNSLKRYYALKKNLIDFSTKKKLKDLSFDRITLSFLEGFKRFLIIDNEYTPGTISTRLAGLTTILNRATKLKVNTNLDFKDAGLSEDVPQTFEIYLNLKELEKIEDVDLSNNARLDRVRDLFLLGCWTGVRFCDLGQINHKVIEQDREGNKNIRITPSKTQKEIILPVLPTTERIIQKYTHPDNTIELPKISNQNFNAYIKELGECAGISESVSYTRVKAGKKETVTIPKYELLKTHTMRRSFATNLYELGEDIKAIMDATGHTRTEVFFNYIRRTKNNSANKVRTTVETALRQRMKAVS